MTARSIAILHSHSKFSDGIVSPTELVKAANSQNVKVLALTDHDTLKGVNEAKKAGEKHGVDIVVGEEIQTKPPRLIHILGLFLKKRVPPTLSVQDTIQSIHDQGGLAIIPHPLIKIFNFFPAPTASIQKNALLNLASTIKIDGTETKHKFLHQNESRILQKLHSTNNHSLGAQIGSSDSHFGSLDLLANYTLFPGKTKEDLINAIKNKKTIAVKGIKNKIPLSSHLKQNLNSLTIMSAKRYLPFFQYE